MPLELTLSQTNTTKGVAILMMLCLHLFNQPYQGLFEPLIFVGSKPLSYYISLFCDCCVAIYCFCSGYGLYAGYIKSTTNYNRKNYIRLLKLYINYWIVLLIFAVVLGLVMGQGDRYPGNFTKFILNFTALDNSYNGAWWFVTTYILLVLMSPIIFKFVLKFDYRLVLLFSFCLYGVAYIQRIKVPLQFNQIFLDAILEQLALFGSSLFPFIIGAIAYQQKWYSAFSAFSNKLKKKNFILILIHCCPIKKKPN